MTEQPQTFTCDLCKKPIKTNEWPIRIGKWLFDVECYGIVIKRLTHFWNILLLSEDEWQEWLEETYE